jgi:hypothetical protein
VILFEIYYTKPTGNQENPMALYELLRGPFLWLAFGMFIGGMVARVILFFPLSTKKDKAIYRFFRWKWFWLSIFHWIVPLFFFTRAVTGMEFGRRSAPSW